MTYIDTLSYLDKQGYTVLGNINRTIIEGLDHAKVKFHIITRYYSEKQWPDKLRAIYDTSKGGNDLAAWQMALQILVLYIKICLNEITLFSSKTGTTFCAPNMYFCDFFTKCARKCKIFCIFTVEKHVDSLIRMRK